MSEVKILHEQITERKEWLREFAPEIFEIPEYIKDNLKYSFFDWQKDAFENFLYYNHPKSKLKQLPTHLMFNLATGTGKTLLMAATILYYYKQWYRHFIFFVNQNNIVDKTENNFISSSHNKYLFTENIVIDNEAISINKVDTFSDDPIWIEIKFTTIHKLYNDVHKQKENQTTLEDLHSRNMVMLADEAHHLNTDTYWKEDIQISLDLNDELRESSSQKDIEKKGWEHTVIDLILHKNCKWESNPNILLEFTATIPENKNVAEKYSDKIIHSFWLKQFLQAWYTKEINLIASSFTKKERVFQALLFNWYRHRIALDYNVPNFKPVILFRSKTILESEEDYNEFLSWIENISPGDFDFLHTLQDKISDSSNLYEQWKSRTEQVLKYISKNNISFSEITNFLKSAFSEKNLIITNSKTNTTKKEKTTEEQEVLLNSLEDSGNNIRGIFTVDRLTEWWDVLNLFDIVRLYQWQNTGWSTKKTPEATTKEKQLIGRWVRYFPFEYGDTIINKRKFDDNLNHELRVLEELYYYTFDEESRYISHLKEELRRDWYIRDDKVIKTFSLKEEFKNSDFYKDVRIWKNEAIDNPLRKKKSLKDIDYIDFTPYKVQSLEVSEQEINFEDAGDLERLNISEKWFTTININFSDIEKHIFRKAINIKAQSSGSLFKFNSLKEELDIVSIDDLQKVSFLWNFILKIIAPKNTVYSDLSQEDKLKATIRFLEKIFSDLREDLNPKIGSEFVSYTFEELFSEPKTKAIEIDEAKELRSKSLQSESWYILDSFYGTSEENELVRFIQETIWNLEHNYKEVYLLRNEEVYKIHDFKKWRGFQPDFILFLKWDDIYYQVFIEPKWNTFLGDDGTFKTWKEWWKEEFLEEISNKYSSWNILKAENHSYSLIWLPFYNTDNNLEFKSRYEKEILTEK